MIYWIGSNASLTVCKLAKFLQRLCCGIEAWLYEDTPAYCPSQPAARGKFCCVVHWDSYWLLSVDTSLFAKSLPQAIPPSFYTPETFIFQKNLLFIYLFFYFIYVSLLRSPLRDTLRCITEKSTTKILQIFSKQPRNLSSLDFDWLHLYRNDVEMINRITFLLLPSFCPVLSTILYS